MLFIYLLIFVSAVFIFSCFLSTAMKAKKCRARRDIKKPTMSFLCTEGQFSIHVPFLRDDYHTVLKTYSKGYSPSSVSCTFQ